MTRASAPQPEPGAEATIGPRQRSLAAAIIACLLVIGSLTTPLADIALAPIPGLLAMFSASMIVVNLLLAALLFIKGRVEKRSDTILLGAAYLYICLIVVPQTASFPGALTPSPLIGTPETSLWFWIFWHVGFAANVIRYASFCEREQPQAVTVSRSIGEILAVTIGLAVVAARWAAYLPPLMVHGRFQLTGAGLALHVLVCLATLAALASVARLRDKRPEQLWLLVGLVASCIEVWLTLSGTARYTLGWYLAKAGSLTTSVVVLISMMHEVNRLYADVAASNKVLVNLTLRDGLTGLWNRRRFDAALNQEFLRARRLEMPLAMVMLDIDFFKALNDRYGHVRGDDCLRSVSRAIEGVLQRPGDEASRYGGEEIAVLLPATNAAGALLVGEKICKAVAALGLKHEGSIYGVVTVSAGAAAVLPLTDDTAPADLVRAADQALYRAKEGGRNCALGAPPGPFGPAELAIWQPPPNTPTRDPSVAGRRRAAPSEPLGQITPARPASAPSADYDLRRSGW